jgi:hypothetical protein
LVGTSVGCGDDAEPVVDAASDAVSDAAPDDGANEGDTGGSPDAERDGSGRDTSPPLVCPEQPIVNFVGAPCTDESAACNLDCSVLEDDQIMPCLAACEEQHDQARRCLECINSNLLACAAMNGCENEWNCYVTCFGRECPDAEPTCGDVCPEELGALGACFAETPECDLAYEPCIMS